VNSFRKKRRQWMNLTEFLPFILFTSSTAIIIGLVDASCWGECKWMFAKKRRQWSERWFWTTALWLVLSVRWCC
jgi:hypothetical protein